MTATARDTANGGGCSGINKRGERCSAAPLADSLYCFFHDPAKAAERAQSRRRGGKARHGRRVSSVAWDDLPEVISFESMADILIYLGRAAADLARLENSVSRARAMAQVASVAVEMLKASQFADRLQALEDAATSDRR